MMLRYTVGDFLMLVLVLAVTEVWAVAPYQPVHPNPLLEPWRWRSFPELKGQGLMCLAEDIDGNMWFGTQDGVWRYDGTIWSAFGKGEGLDGLSVVALAASETGTVYAATRVGIYSYKAGAALWDRFFPPRGELPWLINDLVVGPDEEVWAGTGWGVLLLGKQEQVLYTTAEVGRDFKAIAPYLRYAILPEGIVPSYQVSYRGIGIERITEDDTISWVMSGSPADSAGLKIGDRVVQIQETWIGDVTAPSIRLTIEREEQEGARTVTIFKRSGQAVMRTFDVYDICPARDGTLWCVLTTGEILCMDGVQQKWRVFTDKDGLDLGVRSRLAEMSDGSIWSVSDDRMHGVNRFDGTSWSSFRLSDLGGNDITPSILQTGDGTVWIGGHEGYLHAFRNGRWEVYRAPDLPIPETRIVSLLEGSDGALWIAGMGREPLRMDYGTSQWATFDGLNFACQTADGHLWFLSRDDGVVLFDGKTWLRYGREDGLMDSPVGLLATRRGEVWAVGSEGGKAASAHLQGTSWDLQIYPRLSWGIDGRAAYEASDGAIWLGAAVDWFPEQGHQGGVLRLSSGDQKHYTSPGVLRYIYGIGQTADGAVWIGSRRGLQVFDGHAWTRMDTLEVLRSRIDVVYTTEAGKLWLGHRTQGVFCYDGKNWQHYDVEDGLADNTARSIMQSQDGTVWVVSARGISRFDGKTWTAPVLSDELYTDLRGSLRQSQDGALWINTASDAWHRRAWPATHATDEDIQRLRTVRYMPDSQLPETNVTFWLKEISQPGNATIAWQGVDPWHQTSKQDLQYSWQLDGGEWSVFSRETHHMFQTLASREHVFRVRARDRDFNVDPTPAVVSFVVIPPVWQQPWFLVVVAFMVGATALQTGRVIRRDRRLQKANEALSAANNDLADLNQQLQASNQHLRETREQLVIQEKMASLGNLVAGFAHEMNTPLGALNSAVDVLRRCANRIAQIVSGSRTGKEISEDAGYRKALTLLEDSSQMALTVAERFSRIIESLKNFARLDEADLQRVDVHEGLESILLLRESDFGDRIDVIRAYGDIPLIICYPGELNQVFMNILSNAIEAMDGKGEIRIETVSDGRDVCIAISDSGCGISPEHLDRIFDPGFTTRGVGVGTGLGLATSYRIVHKHGGTISVQSEVGKGSTFTVRIPIRLA